MIKFLDTVGFHLLRFLWIILRRLNTIKDLATSFPSLTLHALQIFCFERNALSHSFQNYYSYQTKQTPQGVLYWGSGFETNGGTGGGLSHFIPKMLNLFLLLDVTPHQKVNSMPHPVSPLIAVHILEKSL